MLWPSFQEMQHCNTESNPLTLCCTGNGILEGAFFDIQNSDFNSINITIAAEKTQKTYEILRRDPKVQKSTKAIRVLNINYINKILSETELLLDKLICLTTENKKDKNLDSIVSFLDKDFPLIPNLQQSQKLHILYMILEKKILAWKTEFKQYDDKQKFFDLLDPEALITNLSEEQKKTIQEFKKMQGIKKDNLLKNFPQEEIKIYLTACLSFEKWIYNCPIIIYVSKNDEEAYKVLVFHISNLLKEAHIRLKEIPSDYATKQYINFHRRKDLISIIRFLGRQPIRKEDLSPHKSSEGPDPPDFLVLK